MDARRCRRAQGGARLREGSGSASNLQPGALEPAARGPGVELAVRAVCRPGWSWRRVAGAGPASRCLAESTARGPEAKPVASVPHLGRGQLRVVWQSRLRAAPRQSRWRQCPTWGGAGSMPSGAESASLLNYE